MSRTRWLHPLFVLLGAFALLGSTVAAAEPAEKPAFKLEPKPSDKLPNGKIVFLKGDSNPEGDQFFLADLGVLQPVAITLVAKNDGDEIKLVLAKDRWDENLRQVETKAGTPRVTEKLRTQGEARMIVKADGPPKPYILIAWVGDEVKPDMDPVLSPMREYQGSGKAGAGTGSGAGGGSSGAVTAIAVLLGMIVVLLLVLVVRKRGSK